ncbi:sacsin-like isoform X2 [Ptychodera flava]|uniref:sacsin-like isoform X2 n=1 Tax=Ptychodera flava TaxID=63121 RepID=UPI003969C173
MEALPGRRFGIHPPPLITYLKDILEKYPEGGQIIKEIIQNADDAHATEVKFLLDTKQHGSDSLWAPNSAEFQGAALYCYNNAVFSEDDWNGIQSVQQSVKKEDPLRVGRFGLGFVSVYHLSDMPSVMSTDRIAFFDPFEKQFGKGETGREVLIDKDLFQKYHDQFSPFTNVLEIGEEHFSQRSSNVKYD